MNADVQRAISLAVECILDAAEEAGPLGAPSGVIYAALSAHGMRLQPYQQIVDALVRAGKIIVEHDCIKLSST